MRAYYNEHDPKAAAWLRALIARSLIAPGDVDDRSIADVHARDLDGYTQCHFFAGIGGWSLALRMAVWSDDRPVWTGSCPCQPFSAAGKRKGFDDDRHLWPEFRRLIQERCPAVVFGEQVAAASSWLGLVRSDLEAMEYAVGAMPIQAASAGADHLRDRFWFVANANDTGSQGWQSERERSHQRSVRQDGLADTHQPCASEEREQRSGQQCRTGGDPEACSGALPNSTGQQVGPTGQPREHSGVEWVLGADGKARRVKPGIRLLVDGFPSRVGLLRGFGNAIDPRAAAEFIAAADEAMRMSA